MAGSNTRAITCAYRRVKANNDDLDLQSTEILRDHLLWKDVFIKIVLLSYPWTLDMIGLNS